MKIHGLQKLTLLDFPEKVACTVFSGGCNFRCPFCHNSALVINPESAATISEDDFFNFLKKRQGILDGVCVSGGEPLINTDIEKFLYRIKELGFLVKLDTNGSFFSKLKGIIENKLADYVAMDIKNSIEKYSETIGVESFNTSEIEKSAELLMTGLIPYEFRTTVVSEFHCAQDFENIGKWLKNASSYYLQTFIDSGSVIGKGLSGYSRDKMEEFCEILRKYIENTQLRGV
ncbi:MAG: anaerobic ribonucleoside-triphosphate reductase activating protein [Oscillospiraceae bacterium]